MRRMEEEQQQLVTRIRWTAPRWRRWSTKARLGRAVVSVVTLVSGSVRGADIEVGSLLWLQGYDGDPPPARAGFAVYGTLRLESIDDSQPVGLIINEGALTNAPGGEIRIGRGAGGSRYISADLIQQGTLRVDSTLFLNGPGTAVRHTGTTRIAPQNVLYASGIGMRYWQTDGILDLGGRFEVRDATLTLDGGTLVYGEKSGGSELVLTRSRLELAADYPSPVAATWVGIGGSVAGGVRLGDQALVLGNAVYGDARMRWDAAGPLDGQLILDAGQGVFTSTVEAPAGGLEVSPVGSMEARAGSGGIRRIRGDLTVAGTVRVAGRLEVEAQTRPLNLTGRLEVLTGARLTSPRGIHQQAGTLDVPGGSLSLFPGGLTVDGGIVGGAMEIHGSVTNRSEVRLDLVNTPSRVDGDWVQEGDAVMHLQMGTPDGAGLIVSGRLGARGRLTASLPDGFVPSDGSTFPVIEAAEVIGRFDQIQLPPLADGLRWVVDGSETGVVFRVTADLAPVAVRVLRGGSDLRIAMETVLPRRVRIETSPDLEVWSERLVIPSVEGYLEIQVPPEGDPIPDRYFVRVETSPVE